MRDEDKLQVCLQAFSMENSLLQSYRALFMMVEAALLALGFVLFRDSGGAEMWSAAGVGWLISALWVRICKAKASDVDRWRDNILDLQSITGEKWFEYLRRRGLQLSGGVLARYLFNYVMPLIIALLWVFIVLC